MQAIVEAVLERYFREGGEAGRRHVRIALTATDERVASALAAAQLAGWVESLPSGLLTLVGEHGARLRKRILVLLPLPVWSTARAAP